MRDGGRSSGVDMQVKVPNRLKLLWLKAMVVSVEEKAQQRLCQAKIKETNASEPLKRCRKQVTMTSKLGTLCTPG